MVSKNTYLGLTKKEMEITFKKIGLYGLDLISETVLDSFVNNSEDWEMLNDAYAEALAVCEQRERIEKPSNVHQIELQHALVKLSEKELEFLKNLLSLDMRADKEPTLGDPYHEMKSYVEHEEISRPARKFYRKTINSQIKRATRLETNQRKKLLRLSYEG